MWTYYYGSFGPGHQSHRDGFKHFHDNYDMDDILDHLKDMFSGRSNLYLKFWEVAKPSATYVKTKIKNVKEGIQNDKKYLELLKNTECFYPKEQQGEDIEIKESLKRKVDSSLLINLHNAGFMYDALDINNWYHGKKYPVEPDRSKILEIIKKSESYDDN